MSFLALYLLARPDMVQQSSSVLARPDVDMGVGVTEVVVVVVVDEERTRHGGTVGIA